MAPRVSLWPSIPPLLQQRIANMPCRYGQDFNVSSTLYPQPEILQLDMDKAKEITEEMVIMPLGGGQEVGRSCILLQYQGRNIMLDCGSHPGREGSDGLPFFDSLDNPEEIDLILVTHFHIDHCAALPYFTEKTNFKGRIFMTHASKAVMKLLLSDNIRLQFGKTPLYTEQDLQNCIDRIEVLDYHETIEFKGIKFSATAAGHVLGAAMFMIDIDGTRILYTGDYSLEEDRHLIGAEAPPGGPPHVMIVESTFGTTNLPSRENREERFTGAVETIVSRGGSCLIPVFALGRAQELLLILDQYWRDNVHLHSVPILYASKLATKSLRVYQTFINMMNQGVRELMDQFDNPFKLKHIRSIQNSDLELLGPCVVMAAPGFMQSGVSRQLFDAWCDDTRHGVVIAGYTIEGTMAHDLLSAPLEVKCLDNRIKPLRCQVEHVSFSAHVDYSENKSFIKSCMPDYIILVHGEKNQMKRLKDGLESEMRKKLWSTPHNPSIAMPENGVKVKLRFRKSISADVVGAAATNLLNRLETQQQSATGPGETTDLPENSILVTENFSSKLVAASELSNHTSCKFGRIQERLTVPIPAGLDITTGPAVKEKEKSPLSVDQIEANIIELLVSQLEEVFDSLRIDARPSTARAMEGGKSTSGSDNQAIIVVQSLVAISVVFAPGIVSSVAGGGRNLTTTTSTTTARPTHVLVEWTGSPVADTVADCVAGLIMQTFSAFHTLRRTMTIPTARTAAAADTAAATADRTRSRSSISSRLKRHTTTEAPTTGMKREQNKTKKKKTAAALGKEATTENSSSVVEEKEYELFVEQMKRGDVNPFKQIIPPSSTSGHLAGNGENYTNYYKDPRRLQVLSELLQQGTFAAHFSSVHLNTTGDKLIIRSIPEQKYVEDPISKSVSMVSRSENAVNGIEEANAVHDAYCYVLFSPNQSSPGGSRKLPEHHAVVHCTNEGFRKAVLQSLSSISD